jgi:hypothetical protein
MNSDPRIPKLSRRQREEAARDEFFTSITMENKQLKRTLWLLLHTIGKTMNLGLPASITLDPTQVSPLWNLQFTNPADAPEKLTLTAAELPLPTNEQLRKLHESLVGTNKDVRPEIEAVGLKGYPAAYIISVLQSGVGWPGEPGPDGKELQQLAPLRWDPDKSIWHLSGL